MTSERTLEPRRLVLHERDLRERLLPELREQVFHVTTHEAFQSIREGGAVLPRPPATPSVKKWSYDSFFRGIDCVCLCDLRSVKDEDMNLALQAYDFLDPRPDHSDPVFLLLDPVAVGSVISYDDALAQGALSRMIVPHIEAGYPGDLPLSRINDVIAVQIVRPPPSLHVQALRNAGSPP